MCINNYGKTNRELKIFILGDNNKVIHLKHNGRQTEQLEQGFHYEDNESKRFQNIFLN